MKYIQKCLSTNDSYLHSKSIAKTHAFDSTDPLWPNGIGFGKKLTKEQRNYIVKQYQEEIVKDILQSNQAKYHWNIDKELPNFIFLCRFEESRLSKNGNIKGNKKNSNRNEKTDSKSNETEWESSKSSDLMEIHC